MAWIIGAVASIISLIIGLLATIVTVIWTILAWIYSIIAAIISWIVGTVGAFIAAITETIVAIYESIFIWFYWNFEGLIFAIGEIYATIAAWVEAAVLLFKEFLEIIHFKLILAIHNIAYMVSEDYRNFVQKLWNKIAYISGIAGVGSMGFINAINNCRSVVLTVSGMMGRPYDIAELGWMMYLGDIMRLLSEKFLLYAAQPGLLFTDLDKLITESIINAVAAEMQVVLVTIEGILESLDGTIGNLNEVNLKIGNLIANLPETIRKRVQPMVDKMLGKIDDFVTGPYALRKSEVDKIINALGIEFAVAQDEFDDLIQRLKRPGDFMAQVDNLPYEDRRMQEDIINDVSTRTQQRKAGEAGKRAAEEYQEFMKMLEALKAEYPPPPYEVPEAEAPARKADEPVKPRLTWNVGDY